MEKKSILITGINGFLGSHLAKQLSNDYEIIGLVNSTDNLYRIEDYSFKIYDSQMSIGTIFKKNNIFGIIHAATIYKKIDISLDNLISTNIVLPIRLYELANRHNVTVFINTDTFFNDKKYKYSYMADYTLSKKHVLEWLKLINGNCKLINMKLFHMYGPNDSPKKFIPKILSDLKNNKQYVDCTFGEQTRDFIYISDVVAAYKLVLEKVLLMKMFVEFEVGTGKETSINEMILTIKTLMKSTSTLNAGALDYRNNEIMKSKANIEGLDKLGWRPKITIEEGIKSMEKI